MQSKSNPSKEKSPIPPIFSEKSLKKVIKVSSLSLVLPVFIFIIESLFTGSVTFNGFLGIIFIETGLFIILGPSAILFEPLIPKKKSNSIESEIHGVTIIHEKKPVNKAVQGLRQSSNPNKQPFTREDQIYWGKIFFITSFFLLGIEIILEFILRQG